MHKKWYKEWHYGSNSMASEAGPLLHIGPTVVPAKFTTFANRARFSSGIQGCLWMRRSGSNHLCGSQPLHGAEADSMVGRDLPQAESAGFQC